MHFNIIKNILFTNVHLQVSAVIPANPLGDVLVAGIQSWLALSPSPHNY